jgi:phosphatidyl-myo-inositol dimannoside synthase
MYRGCRKPKYAKTAYGNGMRILLVTWNYPPKIGGMEMMLSELVAGLSDSIGVQVLAPTGVETNHERDVLRTSRPGLLPFMSEAVLKGRRALIGERYDLILSGSALTAPVALLLGRLSRLPVASIAHGLDVVYPHWLYQLAARAFLPQCDLIIAVSEATRQEILQRGVKEERIEVIHSGISLPEFSAEPDLGPITEELELTGRRVVLSAGRLAKRKGVVEFVRFSLPYIVAQVPETLLLVAGGNPTDSLHHRQDIQSEIQAEVERLGLHSHVRMLGRVDRQKLIQLFFASDVFILPAIEIPGDMEGFGIVLLEAGAAGKPVISVRLGGIPDAVCPETGILVEPDAWEQMTSELVRLLKDQESRERLGKFARKHILEHQSWAAVSLRYIEAFETVLRGGILTSERAHRSIL